MLAPGRGGTFQAGSLKFSGDKNESNYGKWIKATPDGKSEVINAPTLGLGAILLY